LTLNSGETTFKSFRELSGLHGFFKYPVVFTIGGLGYGSLEFICRGRTHWSMLLAGGACFCALYLISGLPLKRSWEKWLFGALAITSIEFVTGLIVNIWLGWGVWSYARYRLNLYGQVCPLFTLIWFVLCIPGMRFCSALKSLLEKAPPFPQEQQDG
jgi:Predicted membrane protein